LTSAQEWLFMILEHLRDDLDSARIRNMALSQMLMDIESNKLRTPFNERPSCRAYAELVDWLKTVLNQNSSLEKGEDEVPIIILYFYEYDHTNIECTVKLGE